ncbi:MAG: prepilin-type N-terminal cleavage/methylation domain-containing protein [Lentisphaerae bacterium]|nr:prepilin-type N-terminal cleavage/methylation domain-containing protein [Lentisphaerota bacterium]
MKSTKTGGFTMLEMLVVVFIIGVLSAAVLYSITRARASGDAARCRANLRNLGQAVVNLTVEHNGEIPFAGGYEMYIRMSDHYIERRGWVNWVPKGDEKRPKWSSKSPQESLMIQPPWFGSKGLEAIRDGTLWADDNFDPRNMLDIASYCCPLYKRKIKRAKDAPGRKDAVRSYAMNGYFGYQHWKLSSGVKMSSMDRPASRTMLFAEMVVQGGQKDTDTNFDKSDHGDQTLDAQGPDGQGSKSSPYESIGFYHIVAGQRCGHVVFVDGHVEVVRERDDNGNNPTYGLATGSL